MKFYKLARDIKVGDIFVNPHIYRQPFVFATETISSCSIVNNVVIIRTMEVEVETKLKLSHVFEVTAADEFTAKG